MFGLSFSRTKPEAAPQASVSGIDVAKIATTQDLAEFLRDGGGESFSGEQVTVSAALKVAAVNRCANILSDIAATAPIHIKDKETLEKRGVEDDVIYMLNDMASDRTGSRMAAFRMRKLMDLHKIFSGNGYARIVRGFRGRPLGLEFMDSRQTEPRRNSDRTIDYRFTRTNGQTMTLPQDEVLHVMGPTYDGVRGMSVLQDAKNQIGFSIASEKHGSALFKNGTSIGDIIKHDKTLSKEVIEALKASLDEDRDPENSGKTLILQGGLEHEKVGMTQADAEFVLSRKLGIIEICMFFGVPPHIAGFTENQTSYGQGVEHQGIAFVNFNVNGVYSGWEAAIKQALLVGNRSEFVEMDDSKLLRGDAKSRWESYKIGRETGVLNANDILNSEGRPSRPGGDEYWSQPNAAKEMADEPVQTTQN